jgi:general secretion pathway protein G
VLVAGVPDATQGGQILYFLRRVPKDPFAKATVKAEESWGLRNYASSAKEPKPGNDVYDVYSQSDGTGINGIPYGEW